MSDPLVGGVAALAASATWAVSSAMLSRPVGIYTARPVNMFKTGVAGLIFGVVVLVTAGGTAFALPPRALAWFAASGLIGLAIGDTAYFIAMRHLGTTLTTVLYQSSSVFSLVTGILIFQEKLTALQIFGALLVTVGVTVAMTAPAPAAPRERPTGRRVAGIVAGLLSGACQSLGIIGNKFALDAMPATDPAAGTLVAMGRPLTAATLRMLAATAGLLLVAAVTRSVATQTRPVRTAAGWRMLLVPTLMGTCFGIFAMQIALMNLGTAIAATLLATTPIFLVPVAWWLLKERPTMRRILGAATAVFGAAWCAGM